MNRLNKLAIVGALFAAVATVVVLKREQSAPAPEPAGIVARPETTAAATPSALPRLLELGADKCMACKMMAPIIADMKTIYADRLLVDFIDVWKDESAGETYDVRVIPLQIFFDAAGNELYRHEGFFAKEDILAKWKELGFALE